MSFLQTEKCKIKITTIFYDDLWFKNGKKMSVQKWLWLALLSHFSPNNIVTLNRLKWKKNECTKIVLLKKNFEFYSFFLWLSMVTRCKKMRCTKFLWLTPDWAFFRKKSCDSQSSQSVKKWGVQNLFCDWLWLWFLRFFTAYDIMVTNMKILSVQFLEKFFFLFFSYFFWKFSKVFVDFFAKLKNGLTIIIVWSEKWMKILWR